jgi:hypothetical protein
MVFAGFVVAAFNMSAQARPARTSAAKQDTEIVETSRGTRCQRKTGHQQVIQKSMKSRFFNLFPLLAGVCLMFGAGNADACMCVAYPEDVDKAVAMAYAYADVIFLGDVTAVKRKFLSYPQSRHTTFTVLKSWKGLNSSMAIVRTAISETACGYTFKKPGKYLVFANWDVKREVLTTNMCELNRRESDAGDYIVELDKLVPAKVE